MKCTMREVMVIHKEANNKGSKQKETLCNSSYIYTGILRSDTKKTSKLF